MAPSRKYQHDFKAAIITAILIISLMVSTSESDEVKTTRKLKTKRLVLGSRPPACVNKCSNCNPCSATLVIPPHHQAKGLMSQTAYDYGGNNHDSYYLVSWKCKCGNKLFQP